MDGVNQGPRQRQYLLIKIQRHDGVVIPTFYYREINTDSQLIYLVGTDGVLYTLQKSSSPQVISQIAQAWLNTPSPPTHPNDHSFVASEVERILVDGTNGPVTRSSITQGFRKTIENLATFVREAMEAGMDGYQEAFEVHDEIYEASLIFYKQGEETTHESD